MKKIFAASLLACATFGQAQILKKISKKAGKVLTTAADIATGNVYSGGSASPLGQRSATALPPEFASPGKFSDPQLSYANLKEMIAWPGMKILKIAVENIGGSDYNINKNAYDEPVLKMTNKPVWVAYQDEGKCFYTKKYFTRQYEGGGSYGELELANSTADIIPIPCDKIK